MKNQVECNSTNFIQTGDCADNFEPWSNPYLIDTIVYQDSIELVYRQDAQFSYTTLGYEPQTDIKIFKIIYSCKKGKWHESDKIEGQYVSASEETYDF